MTWVDERIAKACRHAEPILGEGSAEILYALAWAETGCEWSAWAEMADHLLMDGYVSDDEQSTEWRVASAVMATSPPLGKDSGEMGPWQIRPCYLVDAWQQWDRRGYDRHSMGLDGRYEPNLRSLEGQACTVSWYLSLLTRQVSRLQDYGAPEAHHYGIGAGRTMLSQHMGPTMEYEWPKDHERYMSGYCDGLKRWEEVLDV